MVYAEICARENAAVYSNKAAFVDMLNDIVARAKQYITCGTLAKSGRVI